MVISIIALLIGILLPALAKAREAARASQCATTQRQIGTAMFVFANDRQNRFPGVAKDTAMRSWDAILNIKVFGATTTYARAPIAVQNYPPDRAGKLTCPSWQITVQQYGWAYAVNRDALGGLKVNPDGSTAGYSARADETSEYGKPQPGSMLLPSVVAYRWGGAHRRLQEAFLPVPDARVGGPDQ